MGLDPDAIRRAWESRAETVATPGQFGAEVVLTLDRLRRNLPMRCSLPPAAVPVSVATAAPAQNPAAAPPLSLPPPSLAPSPPRAPRSAAPETDEELVARWDQSLSGSVLVPAVLREGWTRFAHWGLKLRSDVTGLMEEPSAAVPVDPRASLIVAESGGGTRLGESTVLVTAHGNSLRALVKELDGISDEDIAGVNIPTGIPLVYELDENFRPLTPGGRYLDPEAAAGAIQEVANQGSK